MVLENLWEDDDLIICLLRDLGSEFDPIVAAINAWDSFPSLEVVIQKLHDFEILISAARDLNTIVALYTNHASSTNCTRGFNSGCGRSQPNQQRSKGKCGRANVGQIQPTSNRGGGRAAAHAKQITCFGYGGSNHKADVCYATDEEAKHY